MLDPLGPDPAQLQVMSGHSGNMDGTRMSMASGLHVAKFIAAILAMLAIAGCAKQVGQTALASAAIPGGQHDFSVNVVDRGYAENDSSELSDQARAMLDNCSDPCTIQNNNGGVIIDFENADDAIRAGARQMLVIDGFCASACMVMADRARPRACITSRAQFGYHETNYNRPIPLHADLNGWVMRHGGFPSYNGMAIMPNNAAQEFWPLCSEDPTTVSYPTTRTAVLQ
jgi:hypothetical protein